LRRFASFAFTFFFLNPRVSAASALIRVPLFCPVTRPATSPHLLDSIPLERWPRHIAIIMDGNGRWAERQGLPRAAGHERGARVVRQITEACSNLGRIEQLTLYCLSSENWKRPADELEFLMQLLELYLVNERPTFIEHNVRVRILGRRDGIPDRVLAEMDRTVEFTQQCTGLWLNLAINYGGRAELVDAVRQIGQQVAAGRLKCDEITEQTISDHLYTHGLPDPDMLIRTAGELRISNFLLWQVSYAEIWITDRCWPEFDESTLADAITAYANRIRRFGGLKKG
jgi:undecaprenyl diphosphate synthase